MVDIECGYSGCPGSQDEEIHEGVHIFAGVKGESIIIDEAGSVWRGTQGGAQIGEFGKLLLK